MNDNEKINFQERIKQIIKLAGSAEKLAHISGMSSRIIGQYLSGKSDPTRMKLIALANAVNVNIEWLATGKGSIRAGDYHEKLRVDLLECFFQMYDDYEKQLSKPIAPAEKAWSIATLFNFYSARDIEDETVRSLLRLEIEILHELFQTYTRLKNSGIGEERFSTILGDFSKQMWTNEEEAQAMAEELTELKIKENRFKEKKKNLR